MKLSFENIFIDATKTVEKIPQTEYLPSGQYPIIDQGQRHIAGYSNHSTGFCADVPAIIFGDHTRVIKYIDKPFFIGADGVKVLKSKSNATDYKYLFYALSSIKIPNTGYNRHFKWLKGSKIPVYNSTLQKRIAERLDKVQELIAKQKEQIAKLDLLIKSRFLDMFGDPITNPKGWIVRQIGQVSKIVSGTTPNTQNPIYWQGNLPWLTPAEIPDNMNYINHTQRKISLKAVRDCSLRLLPRGTVILSSRAPIGKVAIAGVPLYCNQGFKNLILDDKQMNAVFVCYLLRQRVTEIISLGRGATFKEISKDIVSHISIYVPPLFLQNQFANFVKSVEQQKEVFSARLSHLEVLYKSLMQEYFG